MGKSVLIASGKGGVGKSTIAGALAYCLMQSGFRVCIVDGDLGLRDQDVILGVESRIVFDLIDVLNDECTLEQALISPNGQERMALLPASQFARSKELDKKRFRKLLAQLKQRFDFVLVDCPAGIEKGFRVLLSREIDDVIIVTTPDDVSIRNAERVSQVLKEEEMPSPSLIVNRLRSAMIREGTMYRAVTVSETLDIPLMGEIPEDEMVYRMLLTHCNPAEGEGEAAKAFRRIADRLAGVPQPFPQYGEEKLPWYKRLFAHAQGR